MNTGFSSYILAIGVIIVFFTIVLLAFFKKRNKKSLNKPVPITCGSVSVFFDNDLNAAIIPYAIDKFGVGRAASHIALLPYKYSEERLGQELKKSMNLCDTASCISNAELMSRLGAETWKKYSEGRKSIAVHFRDGAGIVFNSTRRNVDGAYQLNYSANELVLPGDASDAMFGKALLSLLPRCRA